ncbi:DJ-1/PfpI family protein [Paenibacillus hodogayensis]|uniref:DJ-1/PfpI family protein n=1 Tax=Paenibacillus hodogayensis TaxID=279208 RepID=A0ABV5W316_9BACL
MLNVQIVLFDGFDYMDVIGPYEVFSAAKMLTGAVRVEFVSAEGERLVKGGMNGPPLPSSGKIDVERGGILVIPGAMGTVDPDDEGPDSIPVLLRQALETDLVHELRQAMKRSDLIVSSVCGGSLLLAMDGLLEDRYAVTHHLGMEVLGATGAKPIFARVVEDGNLVTGGGVTSGLDVALHLVERELGPQISHAVERLFEYERRGTVWRNSGITPIQKTKEAQPELAELPGEAAVSLVNTDVSAPYDGKWDIVIATPVGKFELVMEVTTTNGRISGTFREGDELSEMTDPAWDNGCLTWSLSIRKPMRLLLKFSVVVHGDRLTGTAKAGLLPASKVAGSRIVP